MLLPGHDTQRLQAENALKQMRLSVAKDLFAPLLAHEFAVQKHAALERETRFDSVDSDEERKIDFSVNFGNALELSVAAADALLFRIGILRKG